MWIGRSAPDVSVMPPTAPVLAPTSGDFLSLRLRADDDPAELQRRLEACLLIVRRVAPVLVPGTV